jgi:hypothetical protein
VVAAGAIGAAAISSSAQKSAAKAARRQGSAAEQQAAIAQELFDQTDPLRQRTLGQLGQFVDQGTLPPALTLPMTHARETAEQQYSVARENLLSRTPTLGGQLTHQLAALEANRAQTLTGLEAQLEMPVRQQLLSGAQSLAFGQPPQTINALNSAATQFGHIAEVGAAQQKAAGQAFGQASALGAKLALKQQNQGAVSTPAQAYGTLDAYRALYGSTALPESTTTYAGPTGAGF